jgi:predicted O-methyltransferase YrrM
VEAELDERGPDYLMSRQALTIARAAKGFLSETEGEKLFQLAAEGSRMGPCLEIGSYCGKSAIFLGEGCRTAGKHPLFSIDHHCGSPEQQPGLDYFDRELYDAYTGVFTTLAALHANISRAGLRDWVIPIVGSSTQVARYWSCNSFGLLFVDGGHGVLDVLADYGSWAGRVSAGGYLCLHDVYPDPADGGQAPYQLFEHARSLAQWEHVGLFGSLGVLRRR